VALARTHSTARHAILYDDIFVSGEYFGFVGGHVDYIQGVLKQHSRFTLCVQTFARRAPQIYSENPQKQQCSHRHSNLAIVLDAADGWTSALRHSMKHNNSKTQGNRNWS
jgi:hypothetical protein